MANESEVPTLGAEQLEQSGTAANCTTKSIRIDDDNAITNVNTRTDNHMTDSNPQSGNSIPQSNPHSTPTAMATDSACVTKIPPTLLQSGTTPSKRDGQPRELSDWAAVQREFDEKDFDTNSVNTSNYTWNSDDKPPEESAGLQTNCTADNLVSKTVLAPGKEETRPGGLDRVCIEWRQDVEWYQLGCGQLPCAVECALRKMRVGEHALLMFPRTYQALESPVFLSSLRVGKSKFLPTLPDGAERLVPDEGAEDALDDEHGDAHEESNCNISSEKATMPENHNAANVSENAKKNKDNNSNNINTSDGNMQSETPQIHSLSSKLAELNAMNQEIKAAGPGANCRNNASTNNDSLHANNSYPDAGSNGSGGNHNVNGNGRNDDNPNQDRGNIEEHPPPAALNRAQEAFRKQIVSETVTLMSVTHVEILSEANADRKQQLQKETFRYDGDIAKVLDSCIAEDGVPVGVCGRVEDGYSDSHNNNIDGAATASASNSQNNTDTHENSNTEADATNNNPSNTDVTSTEDDHKSESLTAETGHKRRVNRAKFKRKPCAGDLVTFAVFVPVGEDITNQDVANEDVNDHSDHHDPYDSGPGSFHQKWTFSMREITKDWHFGEDLFRILTSMRVTEFAKARGNFSGFYEMIGQPDTAPNSDNGSRSDSSSHALYVRLDKLIRCETVYLTEQIRKAKPVTNTESETSPDNNLILSERVENGEVRLLKFDVSDRQIHQGKVEINGEVLLAVQFGTDHQHHHHDNSGFDSVFSLGEWGPTQIIRLTCGFQMVPGVIDQTVAGMKLFEDAILVLRSGEKHGNGSTDGKSSTDHDEKFRKTSSPEVTQDSENFKHTNLPFQIHDLSDQLFQDDANGNFSEFLPPPQDLTNWCSLSERVQPWLQQNLRGACGKNRSEKHSNYSANHFKPAETETPFAAPQEDWRFAQGRQATWAEVMERGMQHLKDNSKENDSKENNSANDNTSNFPSNCTRIRLSVLAIAPPRDYDMMSVQERKNHVFRFRAVGNEYFKSANREKAIESYEESLEVLRIDAGPLWGGSKVRASYSITSTLAGPTLADIAPEIKTVYVNLQNNLALCYSQLGAPATCAQDKENDEQRGQNEHTHRVEKNVKTNELRDEEANDQVESSDNNMKTQNETNDTTKTNSTTTKIAQKWVQGYKQKARDACDNVLRVEPANLKALLRKLELAETVGTIEEAVEWIEERVLNSSEQVEETVECPSPVTVTLTPQQKTMVQQAVRRGNARKKEMLKKEDDLFGGIFKAFIGRKK